MATITLTVTVSNPGSGNKYYIDGALQATVSMTAGNTYKFDQSDATNDGHPLRLSTTSDGTHNSGSAYTTGVTTSGTPGNSGAYTQIVVTASTASSLYYYCSSHSGMGGAANVASGEFTLQQLFGYPIINTSGSPNSVGQIYYNTFEGKFKAVRQGGAPLGAFASGANLPTAKDYMRGIGIQTAALGVAGTTPPYGEANKTNSYNGTSWSELANLNLGRSDGTFAADGTQTGGIIAGGQLFPSPGANLGETETWNGSSWTEVNNLNTARDNLTSTSGGTTTASLAFMGGAPPPHTGRTESWDGTNWTEVSDLNTPRERGSGGGSQTAAIAIDGAQAPAPANPDGVKYTEIWDGTSWTAAPDTNTAHYYGVGWGTTTSALVVGTNPASNVVEGFNGTSWSEVAEMATNRVLHGGGTGGTGNTNGIVFGGNDGSLSNATEEWTAADFETKTVTTS